MKPPETRATVKPSRLRVRTRVRAPGVSWTAARTSSRTDTGRPARAATRCRRLSAKSSSPRIARSGDGGDLGLAAGMLGEELDDLVLDEGRVDVHDDQPAPAAGQPTGRDGDVRRRGTLASRRAARAGPVDVGAGDVELHRRDRVPGEPSDPVDVGAVSGDPRCDGGDPLGPEWRPEDDDRRPARPDPGSVAPADLEGEVEGEVLGHRPQPCRLDRRPRRPSRSPAGRG